VADMGDKEVIDIITEALEVEEGTVTAETTAEDLEKWDSLGHLSILVALDKGFDGKVAAIAEMVTANSVLKILNLLRDRGLI